MNNQSSFQTARVEIDLTLLAEARRLLEKYGFTVAEAELTSVRLPWLLAENGLFALGVVAARTLRELITLETYATPVLAQLIRGAGPKRWDTYLVMLARGDREARGTQEVRNLQYDTNQLRRVVNLGVQADEESVRRAFRPFLPLPSPLGNFSGSAVDDLLDELVLQGIDPDHARQTLNIYSGVGSA
jgi:hypothetical protein